MTVDNNIENYQQLENIRDECYLYIVSRKIFISLSVYTLACWLVFSSVCILDFTGYTQNCIGTSTFFQSLPNIVMIFPVICGDIDTHKLCKLYISIILSVATNVIEFFVINSGTWQDETIKTGCDPVTEFTKGIGGTIMAILCYTILSNRCQETIIFI